MKNTQNPYIQHITPPPIIKFIQLFCNIIFNKQEEI